MNVCGCLLNVFSGHLKLAEIPRVLDMDRGFSSLHCWSTWRDTVTFPEWIPSWFPFNFTLIKMMFKHSMLFLLKVQTPLPLNPYGTISITGTLRLFGLTLHDPASTSVPVTCLFLPRIRTPPRKTFRRGGAMTSYWNANPQVAQPSQGTRTTPRLHMSQRPQLGWIGVPSSFNCDSIEFGNTPCLDRRRNLAGQNVFGRLGPDLESGLYSAFTSCSVIFGLGGWSGYLIDWLTYQSKMGSAS